MPNFGPDHCMERSIDNERRGLSWFERDDSHCLHHDKCCWCGGTTEFPMRDGPHGPHAPKTRKRKKAEAIAPLAPLAPIEAEPVDGGAARMKDGNSRFCCPDCTGPMVKRKNRATGKEFLGCTKFPKCKGTRETNGNISGIRQDLKHDDGHDYENTFFDLHNDEPW